jgi:Leucine-rich repeat (LRR) protein
MSVAVAQLPELIQLILEFIPEEAWRLRAVSTVWRCAALDFLQKTNNIKCLPVAKYGVVADTPNDYPRVFISLNTGIVCNYNGVRRVNYPVFAGVDPNGSLVIESPPLELIVELFDAAGDYAVKDISVVRYCKQLVELHLNHNRIRDISPLQYCKQLVELHLNHNCIEDISALQHCTKLERLYISENPIRDISALGCCKRLQRLFMCLNPVIIELSALEHCKNLEFLAMNECAMLEDVSALQHCADLEELRLDQCPLIFDITCLKSCAKLKTLIVSKSLSEQKLQLRMNCTLLE